MNYFDKVATTWNSGMQANRTFEINFKDIYLIKKNSKHLKLVVVMAY